METFTIEIAGVPVGIKCRFEVNRYFLREYMTCKEPLFTIEPKAEDLEQMQETWDRINETRGFPRHRRPDDFLENNAIHALLAENLVRYDTLLIHGSALCLDGEAYIFIAASGTGKSTHTRLWREMFRERVWMINDDKPMLKITEGRVLVYGTPWDGKHHLSRNACAPLKAVVSLHRAESNKIKRMAKSDAFSELIKRIYFSRDPVTTAKIMSLEKRLLETADFYSLNCNMDPEAARVAFEGMRAGRE